MARKKNKALKYLTLEEIEALFSVITKVRDKAIFRLAYHRGLRISEVGLLQLSDYRQSAGRLFVSRVKGSNSGEFCLLPAEQTPLRAWIRERGTAPGPLFLSRNHRAIGVDVLDDLMKHYCMLANIPADNAHFHALKHSCGTHLAEMEGDIVMLQDHLGHRNVQNTMIYIAVSNKRRDEMARRLSDWGKKKGKNERRD